MKRVVSVLVLVGMAFGLGHGVAQTVLPEAVFVRDSGGNIWYVSGGSRSSVPIYPATDADINALADSGQWLVPGEGGSLTFGGRPQWAVGPGQAGPLPPAGAPAGAGGTPVLQDALPVARIQVDDETINSGQSVRVTVIGSDDKGLDWIEWEATIIEDNENDNRATGDSVLDERHRFNCDGQKECAQVWTIAPTKAGRYKLRARARDNAEQRGGWHVIDFRIR